MNALVLHFSGKRCRLRRSTQHLPLAPHTAHRRSELQAVYVKFESDVEKLKQRVEEQAGERPGARLLMTIQEWGRSRRWRPTCSWVIQSGLQTARRWPVMRGGKQSLRELLCLGVRNSP
jgi:hypothetical protein